MGKKVLLLLIFFAGGAIGFFLSNRFNTQNTEGKDCKNKYLYINPFLGCDDVKYAIKKTGYADTKYEISKYIEEQKIEGKISDVSIYFRDLVDGPWFGIYEDKVFVPASLLKIPILLTYLRMAEDDPNLLKKSVKIDRLPKDVEKQHFRPEKEIMTGETYAISELLENMIVYSDNHASGFLIDYLHRRNPREDPIFMTLKETGTLRSEASPFDEITVKSYASLFRQLYNSSYLSDDSGELALKFLTESKFDQGLTAGVPKNIKIAHKFGERNLGNDENQLHDCGIIYFPKNPYVLCVMTRGRNFEDLSNLISEISKMVWEEVNSRKL